MIYVKDLLELECFKEFTLVSGHSGLNRKVSWPNIAQTVSIREWLVGGDVILMTGIGLEITEAFLTDIVEQAADGRAACIIMLLNPIHIASIPEHTIDAAAARGIPLFAAPWETKISHIIRDISLLITQDQYDEKIQNEFMEKLLIGKLDYNDPGTQRSLNKYGLQKESIVISVKYSTSDPERKSAEPEVTLFTQMFAFVSQEMYSLFIHCHYLNRLREQIFIVSTDNKSIPEITAETEKICTRFKIEFQGWRACVGLGKITSSPKDLKESFRQAMIALKATSHKEIVSYSQLGIYQLLAYIEDQSIVRTYIRNFLAPLMNYDAKHHQELLNTIKVFFSCKENLVQTASALYIHRNTLVKRISKIEEILHISFKNAEQTNDLFNAIRLYDLFF